VNNSNVPTRSSIYKNWYYMLCKKSTSQYLVENENVRFRNSSMVLRSAHFGSGIGPIHLDNVKCTGKESSIHQCSHRGWGTHTCSHNDDVGISCSPGNPCKYIKLDITVKR
jgi:hypothetical protein